MESWLISVCKIKLFQFGWVFDDKNTRLFWSRFIENWCPLCIKVLQASKMAVHKRLGAKYIVMVVRNIQEYQLDKLSKSTNWTKIGLHNWPNFTQHLPGHQTSKFGVRCQNIRQFWRASAEVGQLPDTRYTETRNIHQQLNIKKQT